MNRWSSGTVYQSLVRSFFFDTKVLLLGMAGTTGAVFLTAYVTESILLYTFFAVFLVVVALRIAINQNFNETDQRANLTLRDYRNWETRFTIGSVAFAGMFGVWCFIGSYLQDPFTQITSVAVTFAHLIGVCGRSFPIPRVINLQISAILIPLVGGMIYAGGEFIILGLLLIPLAMVIKSIAATLRDTLLGNIYQRHKAEKLAGQLDTALNNVPQGICLFDVNGRLEVANSAVADSAGRTPDTLKNLTASSLVRIFLDEYSITEKAASSLQEALTSGSKPLSNFLFEMNGDEVRTIKFNSAPVPSGGVIATFEDITDEIKAANKIDEMTRFDRLTGLVNRNQLPIVLDGKLKNASTKGRCAVMLVNLDEFKSVNESMGHKIGDELIKQFSKRLTETVGGDGTCCRFGGDEFAVLVDGKDSLDIATNVADRIIDSLSSPFRVRSKRIQMSCSIGIAITRSAKDDSETLLSNAELAVMCVKNDGRNDWRIFNDDMSREIRQRRQLEADLKIALGEKQFELHYQPIVCVHRKKVMACEALIRWQHPKLGMISPGIFIPMLEELGLVSEIGDWVIEESCQQCSRWPNETRVAVNLSPLQFKSGDVVETVKQALKETGLEPARLELEITESLMLDDMGGTIRKLEELKALGVRISLDDFGTGYSSLSYMNMLPLDKLKIDRSFVRGLGKDDKSLTLIRAISGLGKQLDLTVLIEGVEDEHELSILLKKAEIDEIQGFYFSKPVNAESVRELLDGRHIANRSMIARLTNLHRSAA